jgi:hypothetical protein
MNIEMPCGIGDTVYAEDGTRIGEITDITVFISSLFEGVRFTFQTLDYNNGQHLVHKINSHELGKTVFLRT